MEVIYLVFFFTWRSGDGVAAFTDHLPQASIEQCQQNGAALVETCKEIKFKCIPGLAEGSGTPISPEELMSRHGFKGPTY